MWRVGSLLGGVACMIAAGWIGYSYRAGDTLFEPILGRRLINFDTISSRRRALRRRGSFP
ncbi:hypothetical protein GOC71_29840, partial [Sinorhizobium medicae]|nr:hypothetical protein [Sinorhizobium medicae]